MGGTGALSRAFEFGRLRRKHEKGNLPLLASPLELRGELAPAINLQGGDAALVADPLDI